MSKSKNLGIVIIILTVASLLGAVVFLGLRHTGKDNGYRIGADLPLTGPVSYVAEQLKNGMDLAVEEINTSGGINGRTLQIVYQDNQRDPKQSLTAFRQLLTQYRVPIIITSHSPLSLPLRPLADESRVLLLSTIVSYPEFTRGFSFVARDFVSSELESHLIADFVYRQRNVTRAGILHVNDDYGKGAAEAFRDRFESQGGSVVAVEEFAQEETNLRSTLTRMYLREPGAIYLVGRERSFAAAIVQMRETGYRGDIVTTISMNSRTVLEQTGQASEGIFFTDIEYFPDAPTTEQMRAFVTRYQAKYGDVRNYVSVYGYDMVKYLAAAIREGGYSSEGIRHALQRKKIEMIRGTVTVPESLDIQTPLHIAQVKAGKFEVVYRPN